MSRICIDTSAYIHFVSGHARTVEIVEQATWVGISPVVLGELLAGFRMGSRRTENSSHLFEFLSLPVVEIVPVALEIAELYGELVADLRKIGRPIPQNDLWIAATAMHSGAKLLTFDRHFLVIDPLRIVVLTPL